MVRPVPTHMKDPPWSVSLFGRLAAAARPDALVTTRGAAVLDPCPRFLLLAVVALLIAEADALLFDLQRPHWHFSLRTIGLALVVIGIPFAVATRPRTVRDWTDVVAASLILPVGNLVLPWATDQTIWLLPRVFDAQVVALDASLGFQPAFVMGAWFNTHRTLAAFFIANYDSVMVITVVVAVAEAYRGRRSGPGLLPVFMVIAGIGFPIYHVLPVVGPAVWFIDSFPYPDLFGHLPGPRTTMPSLHTAWVVMAFPATRGMHPAIRIVAAVVALGTIVATLGTGAHDLTDLVVACPLVLLVRAVCATGLQRTSRERLVPGLIGAGLILVWGFAVRGLITPSAVPVLVPAAMLATVTIAFWLEHRLALATRAVPGGRLPAMRARIA